MNGYDVAAWADFALGTAVVAGVVLAAGVGQLAPLLAGPRAGRAGLTLALPLCVAVAALCVLVPGQSATALGIEIVAAAAVVGVAAVVWAGTSVAPAGEPPHRRTATLVAVLVPVLLMLVAGTSVSVGSYGGLTWLFAAAVLGLVGTALSAGLLLAEGV